jgi:hypothetical protein
MAAMAAHAYVFLFNNFPMKATFRVMVANGHHTGFASFICEEMAASARARGTGIATRTPEYLKQKMLEEKAVIAFAEDGTWAGFCYIESWSHGAYVANSGLIVNPAFRNSGLAKRIKQAIFELSRKKYPGAKIFGLTTGLAVMKINSELGYEPVTYSELTQDEDFWAGCKSCVNYDILMAKERKNCLCTAMLFNPTEQAKPATATPMVKSKTPGVLVRMQPIKRLRLFVRKRKHFIAGLF